MHLAGVPYARDIHLPGIEASLRQGGFEDLYGLRHSDHLKLRGASLGGSSIPAMNNAAENSKNFIDGFNNHDW
jgi:hypothetical protein